MTRRRRWIRKRRPGQAMVEFALIAPVLLLIILGVIEFGRLLNAYQTVTDIAREAARTSVIANSSITQDSITRLVQSRLAYAGFDSTAMSMNIANFHTGVGQPTTVFLTYAYHMGWLQPMLNWTSGQAGISLRTAAHMRQE